MALIVTLYISPTTISSGTILRLCKPQDCIKHTCKECIHSSSWRMSSKFFTLRIFGGSMLEHWLKLIHLLGDLFPICLPRKTLTLIIRMIQWIRPSLFVFACCKWLKTGWWKPLWTKQPRYLITFQWKSYNDRFNFSYCFNRIIWMQSLHHYHLMIYSLASLSYDYHAAVTYSSSNRSSKHQIKHQIKQQIKHQIKQQIKHQIKQQIKQASDQASDQESIKSSIRSRKQGTNVIYYHGPINTWNPNKYCDKLDSRISRE